MWTKMVVVCDVDVPKYGVRKLWRHRSVRAHAQARVCVIPNMIQYHDQRSPSCTITLQLCSQCRFWLKPFCCS